MTVRVVAKPQGRAVKEVVKWELYDTKVFLDTGATGVLQFYLNPNPGGLIFTNMHLSGQLPKPRSMDVYGIAVEMFPGFDQDRATGIYQIWAAEKKKIRETAWIQLTVGVKPYLIEPLMRIPEGMGATGITAGADDSTGAVNEMLLTHGLQEVHHYYPLGVPIAGGLDPIEIPEQQSFSVTITWPNPPVLNTTGRSSLNVYVRCYLIGNLHREVQ